MHEPSSLGSSSDICTGPKASQIPIVINLSSALKAYRSLFQAPLSQVFDDRPALSMHGTRNLEGPEIFTVGVFKWNYTSRKTLVLIV